MKNIFALAMAFTLSAGVIDCQAADAKGRVNNRQTRQHNRIYHGVSNGELTGRESARLQKQQYKLARREAKFRKSGDGLTKAERAKLEHDQDQLSKNIYKQKHDEQDHN